MLLLNNQKREGIKSISNHSQRSSSDVSSLDEVLWETNDTCQVLLEIYIF